MPDSAGRPYCRHRCPCWLRPAVGVIWLSAAVWLSVHARADDGKPGAGVAPPPGPTLELLDFIGSWVDQDGQWIDPADVAELPPAGREQQDDETE